MLKFDQDRLLLALKEQGELDFKQIGQLLRVKPSEHANLGSWLNQLLSRGSIYLSQSSRCYSLAKRIDEIEGEIRVNEKNFAFVNPGEERDRERAVFIGPKHFNGALNGDTVLVDVFKTVAQQERIFGIVREVKKRATNRLVLIVTFSEWLNKTILKPLDSRLKGNFQLAGLEALRLNEVVVARIKDFNRGIFHLELERIIGDLNQGNNDIKALLEHYEIPSSWPEEVLEEVEAIKTTIDESDHEGRIDLREELIFTIDGEDTKDFDDALSIEEEGNLFRVGVHIADVAYYVKQDSAIDKEARRRATSIYYLDQTIPMLPPKLSDFLCSLVPNQDRLTITVSMTFDREGGLISTKIFPSLIRSRYRLTYKQVNSFLAGKRNATAALASALNNLKTLANLIRRDRESRGYVDLDISESVINLAEDGSVRSIKRKFRGESELIVEDLMVMANECVATVLKDAKLPAIFRNHPNPSKERIEYLKMLVDYLKLDGDIKIEERHDPIQFSQVVNGIKEANQLTNFSRSALLRSLERAIYSTTDSEHFGLASGGYLHFTSPIRRYPDLVVHRIIRELIFKRLEGQELQQKILDLSNDLADIALNSSLKERAASELEQDIQTIKRARFYRERIGKSFLAEIVAVDRNLLCCELEDKTIGYLKLSQFNTDFETTNFEARSGETLHFQAGSSIWVTIDEVEAESFSSRIMLAFKGENTIKKGGKR